MSKYEIIKKHIDEYDYFGLLAGGAPDDEFDSYSKKLADAISENDTVETIAGIIAKTMDAAFGVDEDSKKFVETAKKIKADLA